LRSVFATSQSYHKTARPSSEIKPAAVALPEGCEYKYQSPAMADEVAWPHIAGHSTGHATED
jgi:hypothetical protein